MTGHSASSDQKSAPIANDNNNDRAGKGELAVDMHYYTVFWAALMNDGRAVAGKALINADVNRYGANVNPAIMSILPAAVPDAKQVVMTAKVDHGAVPPHLISPDGKTHEFIVFVRSPLSARFDDTKTVRVTGDSIAFPSQSEFYEAVCEQAGERVMIFGVGYNGEYKPATVTVPEPGQVPPAQVPAGDDQSDVQFLL